ncbi:MAG: hypothetical protein IKN60_04805 [Bacteroidales bacterium]|nr:hypothetical protein [Bacteroidales bacterium]
MAKRSKLEIAQAWADITIDRWKRRMEVLEVGSTGELLKSFTAHITSDAAGDPAKITFAFLYYGRFPDMGVGRNVKLSDTPDPTGRRKIKPWYSETFRIEVVKLGRMMAARFGIEAADAISAFRDVSFETAKNDSAWYNLQNR